MPVVPDPEAKTVSIPVRIHNGHVLLFYGDMPPGLAEGTVGELVVPEHAVTDPVLLTAVTRALNKDLLPADSVVFFRLYMEWRDVPPHLQQGCSRLQDAGNDLNGVFVACVLKDSLQLEIHGSKKPRLRDAACHIPSLSADAKSLNHAYALVSTTYQPHRASHTGNVFDLCFVVVSGRARSLRQVREAVEADVEELLWGTTGVDAARARLRERQPLESVLRRRR